VGYEAAMPGWVGWGVMGWDGMGRCNAYSKAKTQPKRVGKKKHWQQTLPFRYTNFLSKCQVKKYIVDANR